MDSRPEMARAQFAKAADYADEGHWLTGQDHFLHVPAVMQVDAWNVYGSSGFNRLTPPQRVLLMWADLVGQTANGGFEQFAHNLRHALPLAEPLIEQLQWPELLARFKLALVEQTARIEADQFREEWVIFDPSLGMVARNRSHMIADLARLNTRLNPFRRSAEQARLGTLTNDQLTEVHDQAVAAGKLQPARARSTSSVEFEEPPAPASQAFDDWFFLDETRTASRQWIGDYIRRNRDQLVRLTD